MNETHFWRTIVRPKLISFGVLHRVENVLELGTPDVAYCLHRGDRVSVSGWIELKYAAEWPVRSRLKFRHFTVDQINWLTEWGRIGHAFLLAVVGTDYLLVSAANAREIQVQGAFRERFIELATVHGEGKFPTGPVIRALTEQNGNVKKQ